MARLAILLFFFLLLGSCAHWWQIRPYADFITAEVRPGDRLRIETTDGIRREVIVSIVLNDRIIGEEQVVLFADIVTLEKHSKTSPVNACNPSQSLGCSVPQWVALLDDTQSEYRDFFYPSCEQHDYCYRHGAATYAMDRKACDDNFLGDMEDQCSTERSKFLPELDVDYAKCSLIASEFYQVVKKYGAAHFKSAKSTYCEYDGPP